MLPSADYAIGTLIGIERKTMSNLLLSMVKEMKDGSKELWHQLKRCKERYGQVILLLEGRVEAVDDPRMCIVDRRERKIPYLAVQAVISKIQVEYGITLMPTVGQLETALTLRWLHQRQQSYHHTKPVLDLSMLSSSSPVVESGS